MAEKRCKTAKELGALANYCKALKKIYDSIHVGLLTDESSRDQSMSEMRQLANKTTEIADWCRLLRGTHDLSCGCLGGPPSPPKAPPSKTQISTDPVVSRPVDSYGGLRPGDDPGVSSYSRDGVVVTNAQGVSAWSVPPALVGEKVDDWTARKLLLASINRGSKDIVDHPSLGDAVCAICQGKGVHVHSSWEHCPECGCTSGTGYHHPDCPRGKYPYKYKE